MARGSAFAEHTARQLNSDISPFSRGKTRIKMRAADLGSQLFVLGFLCFVLAWVCLLVYSKITLGNEPAAYHSHREIQIM